MGWGGEENKRELPKLVPGGLVVFSDWVQSERSGELLLRTVLMENIQHSGKTCLSSKSKLATYHLQCLISSSAKRNHTDFVSH